MGMGEQAIYLRVYFLRPAGFRLLLAKRRNEIPHKAPSEAPPKPYFLVIHGGQHVAELIRQLTVKAVQVVVDCQRVEAVVDVLTVPRVAPSHLELKFSTL